MLKIERKFIDFFKQNTEIIFLIVISGLALAARYTCVSYTSGDYINFLKPWFETIKQNDGIKSLGKAFGDYNIPYIIIMIIIYYLPIGQLTLLKTVSFGFDFLLAGAVAYLVYSMAGKNKKLYALISYALVLFSIPIFLNSAVWCQCDSIYSFFVLVSIIFLTKDKPIPAFILFGVAFAFKMQAIFVLPVFVLYYFINKKCSILHFLMIPAVNVVLCIPAFIAGRSFSSVLSIYFNQVSEYKRMTLNFPNLYSLILKDYTAFANVAVVLAVVVMGIGALFVLKLKNKMKPLFILELSIWYIWACVLFLPAMHDRYSYMLCAFTFVLMFVDIKRAWIPAVCNFVGLCSSTYFLFNYKIVGDKYIAVLNIASFLIYSYTMAKVMLKEQSEDEQVLFEDKHEQDEKVNQEERQKVTVS